MRSVLCLSWDSVSGELYQFAAHPDETEYTEAEFPFVPNDLAKLTEYANKVAEEHNLDDPDGDPAFEPHNGGWSANTATLELRSGRGHFAIMTFIWH